MKNKLHALRHYCFTASMLCLVFIFVNGCIPNSDYSEDLSGHYFYRDEGSHVKDILCHLPNHKEIYSEVIGYNHNTDFIIVAQIPIYNEYKTMVGFNLRDNLRKYPTNSKEEIVQSENEADSILKHDPFYKLIFAHKLNYWIISNKTQELYGPYAKSEYENKRKELKVPDNLQIKYNK